MEKLALSIVIPVYKNEESIPELLRQLNVEALKLSIPFEVVFTVDGSPDQSFAVLSQLLPDCKFSSQLLLLSRNFGSFAAIRAGLQHASGDFFSVMAADLQEPTQLPFQFFERLRAGDVDLVFGERMQRADPFLSLAASSLFWMLYRKFVQKEMPKGGIDIFGCNLAVRNQLLALEESNTSLVGLLIWMGFKRDAIPYSRGARAHGKSSWSFKKKVRYLLDSCFAFSDLFIKLLGLIGLIGILLSFVLGAVVLFAKWTGAISVPGYTALVTLILFFGGLNSFGLGVLGEYLWRTFENTKNRPQFIVFKKIHYLPKTTTK